MSNRAFAIVLAMLLPVSAYSQSATNGVNHPAPKVVIRVEDTPLKLGDQTFHFVACVHHLAVATKGGMDDTTEWWELRDPNGAVLYRKAYEVSPASEGEFNPSIDVSASVIATARGRGVLVGGDEFPRSPESGGWVQIFGAETEPKKPSTLIPFGGKIWANFVEMGTESMPPVTGMRAEPVVCDVLRFRIWTGNFGVVYPVFINWMNGKVGPLRLCRNSTSHGWTNSCRYPVQADPQPREERTFVRLFEQPDDGAMPKHVVIEPTDKIEFLETEAFVEWSEGEDGINLNVPVESDPWLRIRIGGQEGWIHSSEDFNAVGLPDAD